MCRIKAFSSMLEAIAFVMGDDAGGFFTTKEKRAWVCADIAGLKGEEVGEDCASTLIEFAADSDRVAFVTVINECHYGSILAHFTISGTPLRFVAIR